MNPAPVCWLLTMSEPSAAFCEPLLQPTAIRFLRQLTVKKGEKSVYLTSTEFRLLHYLAGNPNRPFSRQALIEAVWGYASGVGSDRTVDVHIRHLREKLEDDPADPRWIVTVRGMGYKIVG